MRDLRCTNEALKRLRVVRWVAAVDAVLFILLIASSFEGRRDLVGVLGPVHGANFLLLAGFIFSGAVDKLWCWWYLFVTFATGGPVGALVGERLIARSLATQSSTDSREP